MEYLGYLAWWGVSDVRLTPTDAEQMMSELGLEIPPPKPPAPVDVFRRLGTEQRVFPGTWREEEAEVTLSLHPVESQKTMLVRHVVETVRQKGIVRSMDYLGEVAFYKPPKGQPSKARMRAQVSDPRPEVQSYVAHLRDYYAASLTSIDDQGGRRLIRSFLRSIDAAYLNGVYVLPGVGQAGQLEAMIGRLGGASYCHIAPLVDTPSTRAMFSQIQIIDEGGSDET